MNLLNFLKSKEMWDLVRLDKGMSEMMIWEYLNLAFGSFVLFCSVTLGS
jgi:hypothetical protein